MTALRTPRTVVGQLMTNDPVLVTADMPLADAAAIMEFYRISGLPVVDADGVLVGVVSETDLLRARTTESLWTSWPGLLVRHLMTQPALTVTADADVEDAARLMEACAVHRLVVTSDDGQTPIGVLSTGDLVRAMAQRGS